MQLLSLLLILPALAAPKATPKKIASNLPPSLAEFLGEPPPRFEQKFLRPARELKVAHQLIASKKSDAALKKLQGLVAGELAEHALFEAASIYHEKKEFVKSTQSAEKLLRSFPGTVYADRLRDLVDSNECGQGLTAKRDEAIRLLERCLWRAPWKTWNELEPEATALYNHLKSAKDPLFDNFVAEVVQAMPASSSLRQIIAKEIPSEKLEQLAALARFRTKTPSPSGVKAIYPDVELFDSAMKAVLKEDWREANSLFKRFPAEFPQSEHWDRAQFWIARTEEKLGHEEEARKRFEQILSETPFTYYGLQASIYLKHDWSTIVTVPSPANSARWQGALTTRQALSLWRLRALLEEGLIDYAREEAKFLAAARANGAGIGQEDPKGALLMAELFSVSGNHMAAFSHAYAALSLDPSLLGLNAASLIFPEPFKEDFLNAADRTGVHPLLLTSVAKQESAFLPNAISRADALGLLQLLPQTAKEVLPQITRPELFSPALNTEAGALYLYKLLDKFQGNIALALAGYNAGPTRAAQWQRELMETPLMKSGFDPDAFIDSIPFSETRKYVGNILRNYAWYRMLNKETQVSGIQELNFQWQKAKKPVEAAAH